MSDNTILNIASFISVSTHLFVMLLIFPFKRSARLSIGIFILFTAALFASSYFINIEVTVISNLFRGLLYLPLSLFLYRGQFFQKVFSFFLNFLITAFLAALSLEISRLFVPFKSDGYFICFLIVYLIIFAGYNTLLILFWRRIYRKLFIDGRRTEWILYSLGIIFSYSALTALRVTLGTGFIYTMLILFALWSFCILCFAIINTHEKTKQQLDAEFARGIISSGRDHYQKMDEMHDKLRILRHDYKYHLSAARKMLGSGDAEGADKYLTDVENQLSEYEMQSYCSNSVINALISSYAERCAKLDIKFDVDLAMPELLTVPNYEMCIILGNLLENAVEACEKLEYGRVIELAAQSIPAQLLLMVRNNFSGTVCHDEGKPLSSKPNGGFGLRSVKEVAVRYGGDLLTEWDGGTFTAYVTARSSGGNYANKSSNQLNR